MVLSTIEKPLMLGEEELSKF